MLYRRILLSALCASTLSSNAWAQPALRHHLDSYPADSAAVTVNKIDLLRWKKSLESLPDEGQEIAQEMQDMIQKLKEEKGIDLLWDGLANLGEHFSLAYHPRANAWGEMLFVIDIRSDRRARRLLRQGLNALKELDEEFSVSESEFGGEKIHHLKVENADLNLVMNLSVRDNQILGSFGFDARGLQEMLYLSSVHADDSRWKLKNHPSFQRTQRQLKADTSWFYAHTQGIKEGLLNVPELKQNADLNQVVNSRWVTEMLSFYDTLGFGASAQQQQLMYHGVIGHDTENFTPYQKAYKQRQLDLQKANLSEMLKDTPHNAIMAFAGMLPRPEHWYDTPTDAPPPEPLQEVLELSNPQSADPEAAQKMLSTMFEQGTALDAHEDLGRYWDGRYAMVFLGNENNQLPGAVFSLGLKDTTDVAALWHEKLALNVQKISDAAMGQMGMDEVTRARRSGVMANMHVLQVIVETYGVDYGGAYAPDLATLKKEAQAGNYPYWKNIDNPVDQALPPVLDYREFTGGAEQMGSVFYESIQPEKKSSEDIVEYRIYGYAPNGKLYVLSNESVKDIVIEDEDYMDVVRKDLPTGPQLSPEDRSLKSRVGPQMGGVQSYVISLSDELKAELTKELGEEMQGVLEPAFAQRGQQLYLASNPTSLKRILESKSGAYAPQQKHHKHKGNLQGNHFVHFNLDALYAMLDNMDEIKDPEIKEILSILKSLHAVSLSSQEEADSSELYIIADIESENFPWLDNLAAPLALGGIGAAIALPNFVGAQDRAKMSSVKANMHTFQTLLETYAVDYGGVYPENVEELYKEASSPSEDYAPYWKDFNNPYTSETGEGQSYDDYSAMKDGKGRPGMVYYQVIDEDKTRYKIWGTDKDGNLLKDKGEPFVLSNY